uniref:Reverse transcriptase zinc-binding domain-containing protein n=1 Tax=Fagus sylvatica TaxID=28930 RepID=A0A2N9I5S7_FAGSY
MLHLVDSSPLSSISFMMFEKSINATFIALIPKKPGAMEMKNFRPISLISGVYKIVAKVLANRLKMVVGKVVSAPQNAFVQGCQILDSVLIANECLDSRLKSGDPGMAMVKMDFHVHLNCSLFGLNQWLLSQAREGGFISGYDIGQTNFLSISHLLFEDDTLILCGADSDQLWHLKDVEGLAAVLGCKVAELPIIYLGLPLGSSFKDQSIWNGIIKKMEKRLAGWKPHHIEKIQRDFLWEGMGGEFKYHLVSWDQARVLMGRVYGKLFGKVGPDSARSFKGNGAFLSFWQDHWCGDTPLMVRFPKLYRLASHPEASVQDLMIFDGTNHHWDVNFIQLVHDWELESIADFLDVIYSVVPRQGEIDNICWNPSSNKVFSVNSYYKVLTSPTHRSFPWKRVWKSLVPLKVNFFVWTAALGKVLTIDNLQKSAHLWELIPHCVLWVIWPERNARSFEDGVDFMVLMLGANSKVLMLGADSKLLGRAGWWRGQLTWALRNKNDKERVRAAIEANRSEKPKWVEDGFVKGFEKEIGLRLTCCAEFEGSKDPWSSWVEQGGEAAIGIWGGRGQLRR